MLLSLSKTNKLLAVGFVKPVEEVTWLSSIVVVPKKNGKLRICVDFKKLNVATKKDPYLLHFMDEVINSVVRHEVCTFLNMFSRYHQISIAPKDQYKITFVMDWGLLCGL
jgi:hypothetical protein